MIAEKQIILNQFFLIMLRNVTLIVSVKFISRGLKLMENKT